MDREALNLARRWNMQKIKHWYSNIWCDLLDSLEDFLHLMLLILRLLLSPILVLIYIFDIRSTYKKLNTYDKESRERVRKHIEKSEKN